MRLSLLNIFWWLQKIAIIIKVANLWMVYSCIKLVTKLHDFAYELFPQKLQWQQLKSLELNATIGPKYLRLKRNATA